MHRFCQKIVGHKYFERVVAALILFSAVQLGLETFEPVVKGYCHLFDEIDFLILTLFSVELVIRFFASGRPLAFFRNGWNVFDFLVVVLPLLPIGGHYQVFARVIRVMRVIRLLRFIPEITLMLKVVLDSIRSIFSVSLLLVVFFYCYSVAGVIMFGENDHLHFRDLSTSMLTMFRVVTLEGWTNIMYINMYGCDEFGYEFRQHLCTNPEAHPIESILYFVSF